MGQEMDMEGLQNGDTLSGDLDGSGLMFALLLGEGAANRNVASIIGKYAW